MLETPCLSAMPSGVSVTGALDPSRLRDSSCATSECRTETIVLPSGAQSGQNALPSDGATAHPFYWAGFIAVRGPE